MRNKKKYSINYLVGYLMKNKYIPTYSNDETTVFFNPRKSQYLTFSSDKENFTRKDIWKLFKDSDTIDLPIKAEWYRFKLFKYKNS